MSAVSDANDDDPAKKALESAHEPVDPGKDAGEDDGSTAKEGNEDHLKEDQKTPKY